jgi:hypothetical protein
MYSTADVLHNTLNPYLTGYPLALLDNTILPPTSVLSSINLMLQPTVPMQRESFAGEYVRTPQERVRSLLGVGWVCQVLACESLGNVKSNMT